MTKPRASVVIPAHNEEPVIGRLLDTLVNGIPPGSIEVIVVANGCTDGTAQVATAAAMTFPEPAAARIRVLLVPEASKRDALRIGDEMATVYPRVWVDADVVISGRDVLALCRALDEPGVLAAGPARVLEMLGRSWLVRWYYDVWVRLPQVRAGLFGRGVIAMSSEGHARVTALPPVMGDDLAASQAFALAERVVVEDAKVLVYTPRTVADLLRRRVRTMTSSAHVDKEVLPHMLSSEARKTRNARTQLSELRTMTRAEPALAPKVVTFLLVAALVRWRSARAVRRGDFTTWLRDESSRSPG